MISLNLLPTDRKHRVAVAQEQARWIPAIVEVMLVAVFLTGGTFFLHSLLEIRAQNLNNQLLSLQTSGQRKLADIVTQTTKLNTAIALLDGKVKTARSWSTDLGTIMKLLPPDVTVTSLSVSAAGQVHLEGIAKTRLSFLSLQEILTETSTLKNVTTKSTASKRDNVPFIYTAELP